MIALPAASSVRRVLPPAPRKYGPFGPPSRRAFFCVAEASSGFAPSRVRRHSLKSRGLFLCRIARLGRQPVWNQRVAIAGV